MAAVADLPPQMQERVVCSIAAAAKYEIPANLLLAVAEQENGKPGQWVRHANGAVDVGAMQFSTGYLRELARYGITPEDVAARGCYPYQLAAWRLRMHIKNDRGDLWTKAANYHSRTPRFNRVYRGHITRKALKWADWLEKRFATVDVTSQHSTIFQSKSDQASKTNYPPVIFNMSSIAASSLSSGLSKP
ncbi:transglycosylase SLT domain-containing protein [Azohydromonas lata]|uniref:Transglycosylase SLT domain-containing protein n=1 Tax=Azohydromonas lata TaxID=45677 RepID=A0ABU5IK72_9BURK|nr:transglycosylase SLT domain-containing protein [Azohydromonas lata]MDZ5459281.1 transglycosylase SLT domain-containing protein [Azohydromonas lata]